MTVYFSTDWTLNESIITEDDNNLITLHAEPVTWGQSKGNVCLIATNELNEIIATSGCGEEEPLITERFIRFWAESGFPAQMDIEISELYLEDEFVDEEFLEHEMFEEETFEEFLLDNGLSLQFPHQDLQEIEETWHSMNHLYELVCEDSDSEEDEPNSAYYNDWQNCESKLMRLVTELKSKYNQLPSPPSEIYLETDQPFITSETEAHLIEVEQEYQQEVEHFSQKVDKLMDKQVSDWQETEDLSNESEFTQNILIAQRNKTAKRIELEKYYDLVQLEKEGRQNLRKHVLVKKKDMPPRVDFSLLPNAASVIWNASKLHEEGIIKKDSEEYQEAVKVANNLDLFMQCMKNPKFATLSSFELEKLLSK